MCIKLIQQYACGHTKDICTTPCPLALQNTAAAYPAPHDARRNSTQLLPSQALRRTSNGTTNSFPREDHSRSATPTNMRAQSPAQHTHPRTSPSRAPAFRFVVPTSNSSTPAPGPTSHPIPSPTSPSSFSDPRLSHLGTSMDITPAWCAYYFPHPLTKSRYPCRVCYGLPEWEAYKGAWVKAYRDQHPLRKNEVGNEGLEREAGVL